MTPKQAKQFNAMRDALRRIARGYKTPEEIRRRPDFGLRFDEGLMFAYENIQHLAARTVATVRAVKEKNEH